MHNKPEQCYSCGFSDFRWIEKHQQWACNVCGSAQFKPKTPEEIQLRQQEEARSQLTGAIAGWGLAFNRDWNPTEITAATDAVEKFRQTLGDRTVITLTFLNKALASDQPLKILKFIRGGLDETARHS